MSVAGRLTPLPEAIVPSAALAAVWSSITIWAKALTWGLRVRSAATREMSTSSVPALAAFSMKALSECLRLSIWADAWLARKAAAKSAAQRSDWRVNVFIGLRHCALRWRLVPARDRELFTRGRPRTTRGIGFRSG